MCLCNIGDNSGVDVEFAHNLLFLEIDFDDLGEVAVDIDGEVEDMLVLVILDKYCFLSSPALLK